METVAELMKPREVLVLSLLDFIHELVSEYSVAMKDPEEGIYLRNDVRPVIKVGRCFYSESSYRTMTPLTYLDGIDEAILDENGQIILPRFVMKRKHQLLLVKPSIPSRAIQLAFNLVGMYIDETVKYRTSEIYRELVLEQLRPEYTYLLGDGNIELVCQKLISRVAEFMGEDLWAVYFIRLINTTLVVEKAADYRVIEWTEKIGSKQWKTTST
jgi:hypothetical protein